MVVIYFPGKRMNDMLLWVQYSLILNTEVCYQLQNRQIFQLSKSKKKFI